MSPIDRLSLVNVHGWVRRAAPHQFAWLEEAASCGIAGFNTRVRGLLTRGEIAYADTRSIQLRSSPASERSVSALIEHGWRSASTLRSGILDGAKPDVIVCYDAGLETIAAAVSALQNTDVAGTRLLLHLRPDALILAATPFGRQLFARLDAAHREVGGGLVLVLVRSAAQARFARAAGLPAALAPVALPTTLNSESAPTVDHSATDWPAEEAAFLKAGLGSLAVTDADTAQVALEAALAISEGAEEFPAWNGEASASHWLQYVHSLGNLRSGAWLKEFNLAGERISVMAT